MYKYIYTVVVTEQKEYQEAKPGRNLIFDYEDGYRYCFLSAINVVRFIYGMSKCHDFIVTHETNPAYEFCQTYGGKYPSEQLLRELEEDDGGYWFTVQENYDPEKDEECPSANFFCDATHKTRYYHVLKTIMFDSFVEENWID